MSKRTIIFSVVAAAAVTLLATPQAHAIPAFARKYGTSCLTCHTVYPKLNAFGEAFRRNGYRFPGTDGDYIKQDLVQLGQDAQKADFPHSVWPAWLMGSSPIAVGFNGAATLHPDTKSGAAQLDNNSAFSLNGLLAEAHIWAGGSISERTTFFGEVTFASDGTLEVENGRILFNDIGGMKHAFNLAVGKAMPTLTSFGWHSSYLADTFLVPLSVTSLYGGTSDAFDVTGAYDGVELTGMFFGRIDYSVGINAGANMDMRPTENVYGHIGFKLGGLRLDGEGASGPPDTRRPWEETAFTADAFAYRSASHYQSAATGSDGSAIPVDDSSMTYGGDARLQVKSLELNGGVYYQTHDRASTDGMGAFTSVDGLSAWGELSYVVFPWLVPAVRAEYSHLDPAGAASVSDLRIIPGIAALVLPDVKLVLTAQIESAKGAVPLGFWGEANGFAAPTTPAKSVTEIESVNLTVAYAF